MRMGGLCIPLLILYISIILGKLVLCADKFSRNDFPSDFVFGSGSSAYQVEGATFEDERTPSIWDTFAHAGYAGGATGDIACDEYHKYKPTDISTCLEGLLALVARNNNIGDYHLSCGPQIHPLGSFFANREKEDVRLMVETGLEAYRFSISWSRLIPNGRGQVNEKAVMYYNNLINELILHGIQPHVTLVHSDLPQVLEDEYEGWLSLLVLKDFVSYAEVCFELFGDRVSHWTTFNEANVFSLGGYDVGIFPPKRCSPPFGIDCAKGNSSYEPYLVAHHILLAHSTVARIYKFNYQAKQGGVIGINVFAYWFIPDTNATEDVLATQRANDFYIGWFVDPLVFGDYPKIMKKNAGKRIPAFTEEESKQIKGSFDFIGVNHYTTQYIKNRPSMMDINTRDITQDMEIKTIYKQGDTPPDEFPITPSGLEGVLEYFKEFYGNPPIYVHENGQQSRRNSTLSDTSRVKYLHAYIRSLLDALRNGSNTRGYFMWSFLDLFELIGGFEFSFGLYYVDLDDKDLKRYPKLSAHWYSAFLKVKNITLNGTITTSQHTSETHFSQ